MTTGQTHSRTKEHSLLRFFDPAHRRTLSLNLAERPSDRARAESLVSRMYAKKGYPHDGILPKDPRYATLILSDESDTALGTVTVGSGEGGLRAEESYPGEIERLKTEGRQICEFNALAVLPTVRSSFSLARLFHAALLVGGPFQGHTDGVVEVTRSHARFYERILGFVRVGEGRRCSRVGVSSVLLKLEFGSALSRAQNCSETLRQSLRGRGFYPLVFGASEAQVLIDNLSDRLFAPARILTNRCSASFQTTPEGEPVVLSRSGHPPSVPA